MFINLFFCFCANTKLVLGGTAPFALQSLGGWFFFTLLVFLPYKPDLHYQLLRVALPQLRARALTLRFVSKSEKVNNNNDNHFLNFYQTRFSPKNIKILSNYVRMKHLHLFLGQSSPIWMWNGIFKILEGKPVFSLYPSPTGGS